MIAAITITPELQKKIEDNDEKEAFALNDLDPNQSYAIKAERLQEAEEKATKETAEKFEITEEEVVTIVSKLQK